MPTSKEEKKLEQECNRIEKKEDCHRAYHSSMYDSLSRSLDASFTDAEQAARGRSSF